MQTRDPLYRQTADMVISTEGKNTQSVVREIVKRLKQPE
jgi:shikimate kinase